MNLSIYIPIIALWIIIIIMFRKQKKAVIVRKVIHKRKSEGNRKMKELAERFIGKECIISAFDISHQFIGVIKEVRDGAILIENKETLEVLNLDFVIRIREYPKNKKGKKKLAVLE